MYLGRSKAAKMLLFPNPSDWPQWSSGQFQVGAQTSRCYSAGITSFHYLLFLIYDGTNSFIHIRPLSLSILASFSHI